MNGTSERLYQELLAEWLAEAEETRMKSDAWIDELLESGHRCPACGSRDLETLQANASERVGCRPLDDDQPEQGSEWVGSLFDGADVRTDLMLGTISVSCARCGFLLFDIQSALQEAAAFLRREAALRPADAEGRTTWDGP